MTDRQNSACEAERRMRMRIPSESSDNTAAGQESLHETKSEVVLTIDI